MLTYAALKLIWAVLLGVLLSMIGLMVGMDMGVGVLLRFVGRTDAERRVAINAIGPHWDGNQVWFILGGGAVFAAFPNLYATSFSVFYVVMILLLFAMILRPFAFEYRSKAESLRWRDNWDWMFLISGAVPMVVFGAAIGNILEGVGFHFDWRGQYHQDETFLAYLLNPFALFCGLTSLALALHQGGAMLAMRAAEPVAGRAARAAQWSGLIAAVLFVAGGFWVAAMPGFRLAAPVDPNGPANPLAGAEVVRETGAWLANFHAYPALWAAPAIGLLGMLAGPLFLRARHPALAWWSGALAWFGTLFTVGGAMFPFLMPSITAPAQSLTVWNAASSAYTLTWMSAFALVFTPAVLLYTQFAFRLMRGRLSPEQVSHDDHLY
jgi:cytochrome d ubiquinol oxidase subunit II